MRVLTDHEPALLITDIPLDGYNGLHLVAMAPKPIPAIVVTAIASLGIEADARRLGAEYVVKPIAPEALRELVARMLTRPSPFTRFMGGRLAPRRAIATPFAVRVGQDLGRVVDVSDTGVRLEIRAVGETQLPDVLTLHIATSGMTVPITVVWKRRQADGTWMCGATIAKDARGAWRAFLEGKE